MRALALVLVLALVLSVASIGCASERYVAPWLRMSGYHEPELIAESGHQARGWSKVEHLVGGKWETIPRVGTAALVYADGKVALIEGTLYFENGTSRAIDCSGDVRGRGDRLVCTSAPDSPSQTPPAVIVRAYDALGNGSTRTVAVPPAFVMPRKPIEGPDISWSMLGFHGDGIAFSVFTTHYLSDDYGNGAMHQAEAWVLHPNDTWTRVGALTFTSSEFWMLHRAEPWNDRNHIHIDEGILVEHLDGTRTYR